jgi:hypothetical protein
LGDFAGNRRRASNLALSRSPRWFVAAPLVAPQPGFAETLLREGIEAMLTGDMETGKL